MIAKRFNRLWFNTTLIPNKQNILSIVYDTINRLFFLCSHTFFTFIWVNKWCIYIVFFRFLIITTITTVAGCYSMGNKILRNSRILHFCNINILSLCRECNKKYSNWLDRHILYIYIQAQVFNWAAVIREDYYYYYDFLPN